MNYNEMLRGLDVLLACQTAKSLPVVDQAVLISRASAQYQDLADAVRTRLAAQLSTAGVAVSLTSDDELLMRLAFLALLEADIATIPDQEARKPFLDRLSVLLGRFDLTADDLRPFRGVVGFLESALRQVQ